MLNLRGFLFCRLIPVPGSFVFLGGCSFAGWFSFTASPPLIAAPVRRCGQLPHTAHHFQGQGHRGDSGAEAGRLQCLGLSILPACERGVFQRLEVDRLRPQVVKSHKTAMHIEYTHKHRLTTSPLRKCQQRCVTGKVPVIFDIFGLQIWHSGQERIVIWSFVMTVSA